MWLCLRDVSMPLSEWQRRNMMNNRFWLARHSLSLRGQGSACLYSTQASFCSGLHCLQSSLPLLKLHDKASVHVISHGKQSPYKLLFSSLLLFKILKSACYTFTYFLSWLSHRFDELFCRFIECFFELSLHNLPPDLNFPFLCAFIYLPEFCKLQREKEFK